MKEDKFDVRPLRLHQGTYRKMKLIAAITEQSMADVVGGMVDAEIVRMHDDLNKIILECGKAGR